MFDEWLISSGDSQLHGYHVALLHATPLPPRLRPASMALAASRSLLEAVVAAVGASNLSPAEGRSGVRRRTYVL